VAEAAVPSASSRRVHGAEEGDAAGAGGRGRGRGQRRRHGREVVQTRRHGHERRLAPRGRAPCGGGGGGPVRGGGGGEEGSGHEEEEAAAASGSEPHFACWVRGGASRLPLSEMEVGSCGLGNGGEEGNGWKKMVAWPRPLRRRVTDLSRPFVRRFRNKADPSR
jgi:hypothetical protein